MVSGMSALIVLLLVNLKGRTLSFRDPFPELLSVSSLVLYHMLHMQSFAVMLIVLLNLSSEESIKSYSAHLS